MTRFAENTSVSVEKSKAEIERTLQRYGADQFVSGWDAEKAMIGFQARGRFVRFELPLPDRQADEFRTTPAGRRRRSETQQLAAWEQACRQRWRALALAIKAKLEAVEAGITTFEDEFMAHLVLTDGQRVRDHVLPAITRMYDSGRMPKGLLPAAC